MHLPAIHAQSWGEHTLDIKFLRSQALQRRMSSRSLVDAGRDGSQEALANTEAVIPVPVKESESDEPSFSYEPSVDDLADASDTTDNVDDLEAA